MSCHQCETGLQEGQSICSECGAVMSGPHAAMIQPLFATEPASIPTGAPVVNPRDDLEGIGGWLILIAIGLVVSPLYILGSAVTQDVQLLANPRIQIVFDRHAGLHALILVEIVSNLVLVAVLLALNYVFFTKRRSFPTYFICYMVLQIVVTIADIAMAHAVLPNVPVSAKSTTMIVRMLIGAAIWIPYMLVSRRVKATFVR